jgi:hypothetical protein
LPHLALPSDDGADGPWCSSAPPTVGRAAGPDGPVTSRTTWR